MIVLRCGCGKPWSDRDEAEGNDRVCRTDHEKELLRDLWRVIEITVGVFLIGAGVELGIKVYLYGTFWRF